MVDSVFTMYATPKDELVTADRVLIPSVRALDAFLTLEASEKSDDSVDPGLSGVEEYPGSIPYCCCCFGTLFAVRGVVQS